MNQGKYQPREWELPIHDFSASSLCIFFSWVLQAYSGCWRTIPAKLSWCNLPQLPDCFSGRQTGAWGRRERESRGDPRGLRVGGGTEWAKKRDEATHIFLAITEHEAAEPLSRLTEGGRRRVSSSGGFSASLGRVGTKAEDVEMSLARASTSMPFVALP